jgi:hypothetical protein
MALAAGCGAGVGAAVVVSVFVAVVSVVDFSWFPLPPQEIKKNIVAVQKSKLINLF